MHDTETVQDLEYDVFRIIFGKAGADMKTKVLQWSKLHRYEDIVVVFVPSKEMDEHVLVLWLYDISEAEEGRSQTA